MKKIKVIAFSALLIVLTVLASVSCSSGKSVLRAPDNLKLNTDTLTLSWNKISKAYSYSVVIGDSEDELISKSNFISLEFLDPGIYEIKVKAVGNGRDVKDSEWVKYTFERESETGLKYKLINSGTEYEMYDAGNASGDVVMEDSYRGKPVTSIAAKALYGNNTITSLTVGKYVKTVGRSAFANCAELLSVDFKEGSVLTSLGENTFQNSKKLMTVTFPDSLETLPQYLFSWCYDLKSVTLGKNVKNISAHSFLNCKSLESIVIPDTVTFIGEYAFSECETMTTVTMGSGVKEISDFAFFNCKELEAINLSSVVESIGQGAFAGCEKISSVIIPDSCRTLGTQAFQKCHALASVTLGDGLTTIGSEAFAETAIYENAIGVLIIDGWVIEAKIKEITAIELPQSIYGIATGAFFECTVLESINFKGIKYINSSAFAYCKSMQAAFFDNELIEIGDYAFFGCELLRRTTLGNSLVRIGAYAFASCPRIDNIAESIILPATLTSIGSSAFKDTLAYNNVEYGVVCIGDWAVDVKDAPAMSVYSDIIFPEGIRGISDYCCDNIYVSHSIVISPDVEYIGRGAFYGEYMVPAILLPENLKSIGDYAFYNCTGTWFGENGVTVIPQGTEYIGRSSFYNCKSMVGLTVPGSVKTIGDYAFYGCENLGDSNLYADEEQTETLTGQVIIENGVEHIGSRAFYKCNSLVEIVIPDSVTYLGVRAFYNCAKLKNVSFGNGLKEIPEYTFYKCELLESVHISDSIETVGKYAFRGCISLKDVSFGANTKTVSSYAFYGCTALISVKLGNSIECVEEFAFRGCTSVQTIIISENVSSIGKHAFYGDVAATVLCEAENAGELWHGRWNSSYLPAVFGAVLSADKTYLVSLTVGDGLENISSEKRITALVREGYTFLGFATSADSAEVAYTIQNITEAPSGTTLYTVWAVETEASE